MVFKVNGHTESGRAGLRLRGAPKLCVILVPLPLQYLVVFNKFHASFLHIYISAHHELMATGRLVPLRDWCPRLQLFQPI